MARGREGGCGSDGGVGGGGVTVVAAVTGSQERWWGRCCRHKHVLHWLSNKLDYPWSQVC